MRDGLPPTDNPKLIERKTSSIANKPTEVHQSKHMIITQFVKIHTKMKFDSISIVAIFVSKVLF